MHDRRQRPVSRATRQDGGRGRIHSGARSFARVWRKGALLRSFFIGARILDFLRKAATASAPVPPCVISVSFAPFLSFAYARHLACLHGASALLLHRRPQWGGTGIYLPRARAACVRSGFSHVCCIGAVRRHVYSRCLKITGGCMEANSERAGCEGELSCCALTCFCMREKKTRYTVEPYGTRRRTRSSKRICAPSPH